jgi:hypothetical protein
MQACNPLNAYGPKITAICDTTVCSFVDVCQLLSIFRDLLYREDEGKASF